MNILGIIPARVGSKGIPRKNIRMLAGKPLIAWTIEAAKQARLLSKVVVSSENEEILNIAREHGVETITRPPELATDDALTIDVVCHALQTYGTSFDAICLLQPTCPLRMAADIDEAIDKFNWSAFVSLISVVSVGSMHPLRMKRITLSGQVINYIDQGFEDMRPRQQLPPVYIRCGSIYIATSQLVMNGHTLVGGNVGYVITTSDRAINIDTLDDFERAERWLNEHRSNQS